MTHSWRREARAREVGPNAETFATLQRTRAHAIATLGTVDIRTLDAATSEARPYTETSVTDKPRGTGCDAFVIAVVDACGHFANRAVRHHREQGSRRKPSNYPQDRSTHRSTFRDGRPRICRHERTRPAVVQRHPPRAPPSLFSRRGGQRTGWPLYVSCRFRPSHAVRADANRQLAPQQYRCTFC